MTTVFGLYHPEARASVLVADRQSTLVDNQNRELGKRLGRKLWISKGGEFAFGHSGTVDGKMKELISNLIEERYDVEGIVGKGFFPELAQYNRDTMGDKIPDLKMLSGLIMVTRFGGDPKLYTCFPLGKVEPRAWCPIGSGSEKVDEYMNALRILWEARDYLKRDQPTTINYLIVAGLEAVRRSQSQDVYSSGLDMVVCTPSRINDHFADLQENFGKKLKTLYNRYKGLGEHSDRVEDDYNI